MNDDELWRRHLNSTHLHIVQARWPGHGTAVRERVLARHTDIDDGDHIAVAHPQRRRPRPDTIHTLIILSCGRLLLGCLVWAILAALAKNTLQAT